MWSFDMTPVFRLAGLGLLIFLASCTVEPLNATSNSRLGADGTPSSVSSIMKAITVEPVNERVAQQVRNNLLFAMNGGRLEPGGNYKVSMVVTPVSSGLAVEGDSLSTTSAQASVQVSYKLIDIRSGKPVDAGIRKAVASFDKTPQSFANERADRDAQNRAAKEVALQLRAAIAQALSRADS